MRNLSLTSFNLIKVCALFCVFGESSSNKKKVLSHIERQENRWLNLEICRKTFTHTYRHWNLIECSSYSATEVSKRWKLNIYIHFHFSIHSWMDKFISKWIVENSLLGRIWWSRWELPIDYCWIFIRMKLKEKKNCEEYTQRNGFGRYVE